MPHDHLDVLAGRSDWSVETGDSLDWVERLPPRSVHVCVTSPPYYGLRDYGTAQWEGGDPQCDHSAAKIKGRADYGFSELSAVQAKHDAAGYSSYRKRCPCGAVRIDDQIGIEETPDQYVEKLVRLFRGVRRALHPSGQLWLNLGSTYASRDFGTYKAKDLINIPAMVAEGLRADGWYLRQACPWVKRNPMPESTLDRPNTACEMIFLLTKRPDYFFDMGAVKRKIAVGWATTAGIVPKGKYADEIKLPAEVRTSAGNPSRNNRTDEIQLDRHWRNSDFWFDSVGMLMAGHLDGTDDQTLLGFDVAPAQHSGAHTAVFPKGLIAPMILCGTSSRGVCSVCGAPRIPVEEKTKLLRDRPNEYIKRQSGGKENNINQTVAGVSSKTVGWEPSCECEDRQWVRPVVMDPFTGSGTTGAVARFYGRRFIGCELNPEYAADARRRIGNVDPPLI
jgi:DNA modification methylase